MKQGKEPTQRKELFPSTSRLHSQGNHSTNHGKQCLLNPFISQSLIVLLPSVVLRGQRGYPALHKDCSSFTYMGKHNDSIPSHPFHSMHRHTHTPEHTSIYTRSPRYRPALLTSQITPTKLHWSEIQDNFMNLSVKHKIHSLSLEAGQQIKSTQEPPLKE